MSDEDSLPTAMKMIKARLDNPSFQQSLKGFTKTLQFSLTDLKEDYVFTLEDGKLLNVEKKSMPDASLIITTTNALIESIMNKKTNAVSAYMSGKIKSKGSMGDMMRLQNLMN